MLNIKHQVVEVRIGEGKQRSAEFAKINPFRKVPAITDNDFNLAESHTIARYIIKSRNIVTPLYPLDDVQKQAKIDEYLDYHHTGTRKCAQYFFNLFVAPKLGLETTVKLEQAKKEAIFALKYLDTKLSTQSYVCGENLTLADLSAYCEIVQLNMLNWDFSKFPNLIQWMNKISQIKEVGVAHQVILKIVQNIKSKAKL